MLARAGVARDWSQSRAGAVRCRWDHVPTGAQQSTPAEGHQQYGFVLLTYKKPARTSWPPPPQSELRQLDPVVAATASIRESGAAARVTSDMTGVGPHQQVIKLFSGLEFTHPPSRGEAQPQELGYSRTLPDAARPTAGQAAARSHASRYGL